MSIWKNLTFIRHSFQTLEAVARRRSVRKVVLRNFVGPATLLKKRLWHRCFPVNFAKFLRKYFLQNISSGCSLFDITINSSLSSILFDLADILILRNIRNLLKSCFSSLWYFHFWCIFFIKRFQLSKVSVNLMITIAKNWMKVEHVQLFYN